MFEKVGFVLVTRFNRFGPTFTSTSDIISIIHKTFEPSFPKLVANLNEIAPDTRSSSVIESVMPIILVTLSNSLVDIWLMSPYYHLFSPFRRLPGNVHITTKILSRRSKSQAAQMIVPDRFRMKL
jgi:hypothetical protein